MKRLFLHLLKGIIWKKLKTKKIKLAFNTTTMKQEIVIENLDYSPSATRSKDLSTQSKKLGKSDQLIQSRSMNKLIELSKFKQIYQTQITDTPIFDYSCEITFFKRDICFVKQANQTTQNNIRNLSTRFENVKYSVENGYICKHCKKAIEHEKITKYAASE